MLTFRYEYGSIYEIQKAPVTKNINLTKLYEKIPISHNIDVFTHYSCSVMCRKLKIQ